MASLASLDVWRTGHADCMEWAKAFVSTLRTGAGSAQEARSDPEAGPLPWPSVVFIELAVLQFLVNVGLRAFIVQPLAKRLMLLNTNKPRKVKHDKIVKFAQSTLETLFYSIYFIMGFRLVRSQPWLWPSSQWWANQPDNRSIGLDARFFYIAYCARYFQNFVMVFIEPKRKDFLEMQIHHFVTCALIYLSYTYGFVRIGLVIMVLLDVADPPLHIAKQLVYMKEIRGPQKGIFTWSNGADVFFAIFAVVFTVTRMVMYPYVVWSVTVELYTSKMGSSAGVDLEKYYGIVGLETFVCIALVWVLQFLQIFWWMLLVNAVRKVLTGSDLKDDRSDSEHSDAEVDDKKTK